MTTATKKQQQQQQLQQQQLTEGNENIIDNNNLSTFSFLPLQYSFGHRLKSTSILPPFSKLFFTGTTKQMLSASATLKKDQQDIIHDEELCMFYIKLDTKGTKGKKKIGNRTFFTCTNFLFFSAFSCYLLPAYNS